MKRVHALLKKRWLALGILLALSAAIGGSIIRPAQIAIASDPAQAPRQVDLELKEWEIIPKGFEAQAGERVVFNIKNTGQFGHALEVSNSAIHLHSATIRTNETTTLEVNFEFSGKYLLVCPVPGHEALGMVGETNAVGGQPPPASDAFIGKPLMRITPRSGTKVEGSSQAVGVVLHDFKLNPSTIGSSQNKGGEGYWALFIDDKLLTSVGATSFMLGNLPVGDHTIKVELRNNDRTPLNPPLSATTMITVALPAQPATPMVGEPALATAARLALALGATLLVGGVAALTLARRRAAA